MKRSHNNAGFTLVEMLVVIAIIGILAGLVLGVLPAVFGSSKGKVAQAEIAQLLTALTVYEEKFGDYPASGLPKGGNGINEGVENLVGCLSTMSGGGPFFEFKDDRLENLDKDKAPKSLKDMFNSRFQGKELFEFVDPFGNPYIYFHHTQLTKTFSAKYTINGKTVLCKPAPPGKTGVYPGEGSCQILSAGPNGKYEQGGGDDVTSWK